MKVTYWLYDGERVLTAVRAEAGTAHAIIIGDAIRSHERVPLCYPEFTPYEFTRMLRRAEVRA
jgi:hypothetical protein